MDTAHAYQGVAVAFDLIGKTLGPYRIDALLGAGGMAEVYKAFQPSMDRFVAVKALSAALSAQPEFRERFRREAKLIAQLKHTHILPVYDFGEAEGHAYLTMPLMENGTIASRVRGRRLPLDDIVRVGTQIGDALDYAHEKGMVHRDVKPGNILLDMRGNCLLSDFGIARMTADTLTPDQSRMGTPAYMSPEQAEGVDIDGRADVYSLGIVLYELATGRRPFDSTDPNVLMYQHAHNTPPAPRSIDPTLPEQLEWVILHAMAKRPADRFINGAELARALRPLVTSERSGPDAARQRSAPELPIVAKAAAPVASDAATAPRPKAAAALPDQTAPLKTALLPAAVARPTVARPTVARPTVAPDRPVKPRWRMPKFNRIFAFGQGARPAPANYGYGGPNNSSQERTRPLLNTLFAGLAGAMILVLLASAISNLLRSINEQAAAIAPPTATYAAFATPLADATATRAAPIETPMLATAINAADFSGAPVAIAPVQITETPLSARSVPKAAACARASALALGPDQLQGLGCPSQALVPARRVIVQKFERGIMVLFLRNNTALNGGTIYALTSGGRAWRISDNWAGVSRNRDTWYSCRATTGQTPAQSGVPWRGFGRAWCKDPALAASLGAAIEDEADIRAAFQSYTAGRAFRLDNWSGTPGFAPEQIYAVALIENQNGVWR